MSRIHRDKNARSARLAVKRQSGIGTIEHLESRCLMAARVVGGVWTITGDDRPLEPDDQILVDRDPSNPTTLRVTMNGSVISTRLERRLRGIRILAGNGNDSVTIDESRGPILRPVTIFGGAGDDSLGGASGRDLIDGGFGRDSLLGGAGNDSLHGGADANRLEGGVGNDSLRGGSGNDTIWGGDGDDRIDGLAGRDRLQGGDGRDKILGGTDNDTLIGNGDDPVSDDGGVARATTAAGTGSGSDAEPDDDVLDGGAGDNVLVGGGGNDTLLNGRPPQSLEPINSCTEVASRLAEQAEHQYDWFFGGGWGRPGPGGVIALDNVLNSRFGEFAASASVGGSGAAPSESGDSFSNTNTQEVGVDEADIVKTDGSSIFILRNQEFIVVDAVPATDAEVISRTEIAGYAIDMFLRGDRVMIFSSVFIPFDDTDPIGIEDPVGGNVASLVARPFWLPRGTSAVKITVLDVSDPAQPSVVHESFLDGSYINSRAVDGRVYVVLNNSPRFPMPIFLLAEDGNTVESPENFQKRLVDTDPATFLPQFRSLDYTESGVVERTGNLLVDCEDIYKTPTDDFLNLTTVLAFDLDAETIGGPLDSATVFGYVNTVYASAQNLYLIQQSYTDSGSVAGIHKIALGHDIHLEASGEVPGNVLNQFSVDEAGDYFRIATTSQSFDGVMQHTENNVYVLGQDGDTLNVVGSIEDLAPGERIFAARFFDDEGFVVTFRQVDPLFALDLANPTDPQVAGVLKIPGYSSYLHPVNGDHLLAIGRDADETGRVRGLQVSLFDVSDLSTPRLVDQYLIQPEGGWSWSAAEWNHHAFGYFAAFGVLSIPVDGSVLIPAVDDGDPATPDYPQFEYRSNFWVFQVDLASGFDVLGQIDHSSQALRSIRIGEVLYTLAFDNLKAQPILTPAATTTDVSLVATP